jgi:DNA repair protein RadC
MDEGKVLICNLTKGQIGEDTSALLGSMLITRIFLAATSRADIPEEERRPFFLYVDEFPSFGTQGTFSSLLSEACKFKLAVMLAHQYLAQLGDDLRSAIFGNVDTVISFRMGAEDAGYLAREFAPVFSEADFVNLANHEIYLKLSVNGLASSPFSARTFPPKISRPASPVTINDWPRADRPREKLLDRGAAILSNAELLAILLRSAPRGGTALDQARALLAHVGDDWHAIGQYGPGELRDLGLGDPKVAQVLAAVELAKRYGEHEFKPGEPLRGSGDIYAHFRERLAVEMCELFYAVLLDNKHRKLCDIMVSKGSLTASIVHPRDVFTQIVKHSAAAVVFVHNHPSGDATPSREDIEITRRLREVGELMGVRTRAARL